MVKSTKDEWIVFCCCGQTMCVDDFDVRVLGSNCGHMKPSTCSMLGWVFTVLGERIVVVEKGEAMDRDNGSLLVLSVSLQDSHGVSL